MKEINDNGGVNTPSAGLDLLRDLAGLPARHIHVARHEVRARIIQIHRDPLGRVTGTTEQIEEVQFLDATGDWLQ